jgi:hypothetical protein
MAMQHFSPKSLILYITLIGSVTGFFSAIASYGNNYLEALPRISGSYRLEATNLPACLQSAPLTLTIAQSGKYLSGFLLSSEVTAQQTRSAEKRPTLTGEWEGEKWILSGSVSELNSCPQNTLSIELQGYLNEEQLRGQLSLPEINSSSIDFIANPL